MYRYQGTDNVANWICFGTTDNCSTNDDLIDKYMYRIIGINPNGELYLLKETFLKEGSLTEFAWNDEYKITGSDIDVCPNGKCPEWNETDLFKRINGIANGTKTGNGNANDGVDNDTDIFVDNEYYDYLRSGDKSNGGETSSEWYSLIVDHNWMYGDTIDVNYSKNNFYEIETGQIETSHYIKNEEGIVELQYYKWIDFVNAKIGLMYLHDVTYAYANCSNGECIERGNPVHTENIKNSWIHFRKDSYNLIPGYEWLISRWGTNSDSDSDVIGRNVNSKGYLYDASRINFGSGVRPVFYLSTKAKIAKGNGTKSNPFRIS